MGWRWADEGLTKGLKLFMVASLRYHLSWWYLITLIYSHINATPQFLQKRTPHTKWLLHYIFITWPDPDKHQMVKFPNHLLPLYIPDTMKDLVAPEAKNNLSIHPERT